MKYTEKYLTEHSDEVNWSEVSRYIDLTFSPEFFEKFREDIKWLSLEIHSNMTTELAQKYEKEIGSKRTYKNGRLHDVDGNPALIYKNGIKEYYQEGRMTKRVYKKRK